nr:MAG: hypothetical protein 1 [Leviviridae sp.]
MRFGGFNTSTDLRSSGFMSTSSRFKPPDVRTRAFSNPKGEGTLTTKEDLEPWPPWEFPPGYRDIRINSYKATVQAGSAHGSQTTYSEYHTGWKRNIRSGFTGNVGGDFYTTRTWVECNMAPQTLKRLRDFGSNKYTDTYVGPIVAPGIIPGHPDYGGPDQTLTNVSELDKLGASIVAQCSPTNSVADLSVALGELIGGLPKLGFHLWEGITHSALKSGASDYLNLSFGWKPMVNDILKFGYAVQNANLLMKQYERDAGRLVRRRFELEPQHSVQGKVYKTTATPIWGPQTSNLLVGIAEEGDCTIVDENTTRRWFSGAFCYHLPSNYYARGQLGKIATYADKLLGIELTPETLWNLAPWSWAVDWFTNAGDVLSNISDWKTDGLVMPYGYVMEHVFRKRTVYCKGRTIWGNPTVSPTSYIFESKTRRAANPFGFGMTWGGLSPRQLSIAAALGLSNKR